MLPDPLITPRLRCERFTDEHVPELAILDTDERVQATIFGHTFALEETRARVARRVETWNVHGCGDYVVRLPSGEFVGCAGVFPAAAEPGAVNVGYALRPEYWGRGYASELCAAVAQAVAASRPTAIRAVVLESNLASRRVLEKSGFQLVGPNPDDPETLLYRYPL
ncbi:MAG TPA: GNAT family N-acetyltransferase [Candidatus Sulfotelmatobacter sp.]|nr:GNAT family N-acetyltransferase [Candidatus Sulfotelmatobacter sp.]